MASIREFWADRRGKLVIALIVVIAAVAVAALALSTRFKNASGVSSVVLAAQQPHRAIYDLSLGRIKSGTEVQDISGRMVVEWRGGVSCGGYSSEQRIVTRVADSDGNIVSDDVRVTTWEAADSSEFHFDRSEYLNGVLNTQESGVAHRSEDGKTIILEKDGANPVPLPGDTMFPTAFNNLLASEAAAGKNRMSAPLFDGTEDKISTATAFIGKLREASPDADKVKIDNMQFGQPVKGQQAWPVRMSYFDHAEADGMPSFQMGFLLFKNGISSQLTLEYDDVLMKGELVGVEYFKPGSC